MIPPTMGKRVSKKIAFPPGYIIFPIIFRDFGITKVSRALDSRGQTRHLHSALRVWYIMSEWWYAILHAAVVVRRGVLVVSH